MPKSSVELRDVDLMKAPPADNVDPNIEAAMKELVDRYRPVRQRTVRSESTKDKAGALPPAVYSNTSSCTRVTFQDDVQDDPGTGNKERVDQDTNIPRATNEVPRITFVDESMLGVVAAGDVTDIHYLNAQEWRRIVKNCVQEKSGKTCMQMSMMGKIWKQFGN